MKALTYHPHHFLKMLNSERTYVDLIFRATKKYASWDLEVLVILTPIASVLN